MSQGETAAQSRRSSAGFLSSTSNFFLPVSPYMEIDRVAGYPIDLRVKARSIIRDSKGFTTKYQVNLIQYGLGCYERWLAGDGDSWLDAALTVGRGLVEIQAEDGAWVHAEPLAHTFPLRSGWRSAMAQGEGASLLVRLFQQTRDQALADAALRALEPMRHRSEKGGVRASLGGGYWLEEYPTQPPSHVLNGAIFALWGLRDVAVGLGDNSAAEAFEQGVETLATNLHRFDTGWWSLYSLYPHPIRNVASPFYHDLHINQLEAMNRIAPRAEFTTMRERWIGYAASAGNRRRAFIAKAAFRFVIPRNPVLARRLPWIAR